MNGGLDKPPRPNEHGGWNKRGLGNDQKYYRKGKGFFSQITIKVT